MASKLKLTELLYPTSTTPAITLNSDNTVTFGASTTTITNLSATSITDSGNLTFTGTGNRIRGDFSNATAANQVAFQTSTTNGGTTVSVIPNGTGVFSQLSLLANSDPANASRFGIRINSSSGIAILDSTITGTGTYLPITFYTGGSERLRLTTDGNLGLGVTPSAWAGSSKAIQTPAGSLYAQGGTSFLILGQNVYGDGTNDRYVNTAAASRYYQNAGSHVWNVAPSGTAGNAISFTQAMTLTSGGNLGVGIDNPAGRLHLVSGAGTKQVVWSDAINGTGYMDTASGASRIYTNVALAFGTGGDTFSEKARITSGGNFYVGTQSNPSSITSPRGAFVNGNDAALYGVNNGVDASYTVMLWNQATSGGRRFMRFNAGSSETEVGTIIFNGSSTVYATSSDYRLKNITGELTNSGVFIDALKPKVGTWIADGSPFVGFLAHEFQEVSPSSVTGKKDAVDKNGNPEYQGMQASSAEVMANIIAELQSLRKRVAELEAVVPDCVTGEKDAVDAEGNPQYQGVDTSFLVATLVSAIQELKAEFDAYKLTHP